MRPEFRRRSCRRILRLVPVDSHEHLRVDEEPRDEFTVLIAEVAGDGGLDRVFLIGTFAFDHGEGNAVDEENDVRAAGLSAVRALDLEFFGDVKDVVFGTLPINVIEREALRVAVNRLLETFTQ